MAQNLGNLFIDGEDVIEDENGTHSITNSGATINTDQKKFGASSIDFSSGYISVADSDDWDVINNNFTIDFWIYKTTAWDSVLTALFTHAEDSQTYFTSYVYGTGATIYMDAKDGTTLASRSASPSSALTTNTWHHIAYVYDGSSYFFFVDGVKLATSGATYPTMPNLSAPFIFGRNAAHSYPIFDGYMDNIRITKGTALWTENFNVEDTDAMFYTPIPETGTPYVRPNSITEFYSASSQGSLRGKASQGFIRPTIQQFFAPYRRRFEEISATPILYGYTEDQCEGGIGTVDSMLDDNILYQGSNSFDNDFLDPDSMWYSAQTDMPHWLQYDFGAGNEKQIRKYTITSNGVSTGRAQAAPYNFTFEGSDNGVDGWNILDTKTSQIFTGYETKEYEVSNVNSYRYYRILVTANNNAWDGAWPQVVVVQELEMMEGVYE